jgi:hypothetical protein
VYHTLGNQVFAEARLYMRIGLVNRYSFPDNANDSVSGANGTIYQSANYPATFIDAPGTSGDPTKRQLYLANGPTRTGSAGGLLAYVDLPNGVISTLGTQATFMLAARVRFWQQHGRRKRVRDRQQLPDADPPFRRQNASLWIQEFFHGRRAISECFSQPDDHKWSGVLCDYLE